MESVIQRLSRHSSCVFRSIGKPYAILAPWFTIFCEIRVLVRPDLVRGVDQMYTYGSDMGEQLAVLFDPDSSVV